ncbi:MAG: NIPSNAP family protein [Chloroflexi bacterium]|nr:NIPSNAP family protein [Chloroflexota bacterium]
MIYEQRIYKAVPGKLGAINARFANHTIGFFEEFNIGMVGFWNDEIGASNQLTYILSFDSMADREEKWSAFGAHKPWLEVRAETEANGPLVAQVINSFMSLTPYSPQPSFKTTLQEKRVYEAMPGKLPDLHNRFSNHTMALFEKHGIENVAYWTEVVGTSNRLVYMLGYPDLGAREKSFAAFGSDPAWHKARAASEENGALVRVSKHSILRLTDYSPR